MLKMAGFPPNLDDGELWPPYDIFLNEGRAMMNRHNISKANRKISSHNFVHSDFRFIAFVASKRKDSSLPQQAHPVKKQHSQRAPPRFALELDGP
ncbi:hypothetical protein L3X38_005260 [Prunus dulcis]|uniref:Uncharacterized protein n=1 Tax=Prunus dulcis TaxID=3755 RepID=A0AAD5F3Y8_PRUDU|nr:hypothetical protein L3X38_005260 [Prunus dulcis]